MGSLADCITDMTKRKLLDIGDAEAIAALAREYVEADGLSEAEAARQAIRDQSEVVEKYIRDVIALAQKPKPAPAPKPAAPAPAAKVASEPVITSKSQPAPPAVVEAAVKALAAAPKTATESADLTEAGALGKARRMEVSGRPDLAIPANLLLTSGGGAGPVNLQTQAIDEDFARKLAYVLNVGKLSAANRAELELIQLKIEQLRTKIAATAAAAEDRLRARAAKTEEGRAAVEREERNQKAIDEEDTKNGLNKAGRPRRPLLYTLPLLREELLQVGAALRAQAKFEMAQGRDWQASTSTARRLISELWPSMSQAILSNERLSRQYIESFALLSDTQIIQMVHVESNFLRDNTLAKQLARGPTEVASVATLGETKVKGANTIADDLSTGDFASLVPLRDDKMGRVGMYGDVPVAAAKAVNAWLRIIEGKFGKITDNVTVMSMGDMRRAFPLSQMESWGGAYKRYKDADGKMQVIIAVDWSVGSETAALEVLAHEVGHYASEIAYANASPTEKAAIDAAFRRWRTGHKGSSIAQILASRMLPFSAIRVNDVSGISNEYALDFREWSADNVARWLLTSPEPVSVVDKFFAKIAAVMREVYRYANPTADPAWQQLMDSRVAMARAAATSPGVMTSEDILDASIGTAAEGSALPNESELRLRIDAAKARREAEKDTESIAPLRKAVGEVLGLLGSGKKPEALQALRDTAGDTSIGQRLTKALMSLKTLRDLERKYRELAYDKDGKVQDPKAAALSAPLSMWVKLKGEQATLSNSAQEPGIQAQELANQLDPRARELLERVMYVATRYGVHPDIPLTDTKNKHLLESKDPRIVEVNTQRYIEARATYEMMASQQAASVKAYEALRDAASELNKQTIRAQIATLKDSKIFTTTAQAEGIAVLEARLKDEGRGPYFPTMRFGDWIVRVVMPAEVVRGEGDAFFTSRSAAEAERRAQKSLNPGATIKVEETDTGEFQLRIYRTAVRFYASLGEAKAGRAELEAEVREEYKAVMGSDADFDTAVASQSELDVDGEPGEPIVGEPFGKVDYYNEVKAPPIGFIAELRAAMADQKADAEVVKVFETLYIESLPEFSFRKSLLPRQNILGADKNMLRAYNYRLSGAANRYATIVKGAAVNEVWAKIYESRKVYPEAADVSSTLAASQALLAKRMEPGLLNTAANVVTDASSFFSLAFSPVYILMNMMQPAMVTTPILGGLTRPDGTGVGMVKSAKYLKDAYEDAVGFFGKRGAQDFIAELRRFRDQKSEGKTLQDTAQDLVDKFGKTEQEKKMLKALLDRGTLDFSFLNSLEDAMGGGKFQRKWGSAMRMGMAVPQQVEAMNRVTTALAAHRIAVNELGYPQTNDNELADINAFVDDMVSQTQLDYSKLNRPVQFNKMGWNIILQFKLYMQGMYMLMARNGAAMLGPRRPGETDAQMAWRRKQGARTLGYFFLTHAAVGGATGITPLTAIPQAMLGMLAAAGFGDDDDEWKDNKTLMRQMVDDMTESLLGEETGAVASDVLEFGLPALAGINLSDRLGLPVLWDSRYMGGREGDNAGTTMDKGLIYVMGAPWANAKRVVNGLGDAANGDPRWTSGLPAGLRGVARSVLYAKEGLVDRDGDQFIKKEDLALGDLAATAFGVPTLKVSKAYQERSTRLNTKASMAAARVELVKKFRTADDSAEREEIWREAQEFSKTVPAGFRITREQLAASRAGKKQRDSGMLSKQDAQVQKMVE